MNETQQNDGRPSTAGRRIGGRLSRRALLARGAVAGAGVSIAALLAACGGSSSSPTTAATTSSGAATTAPTSAATKAAATSASGTATAAETPKAVPATPVAAATTAAGQSGGTLNFGLLRDPIAFDPHKAYGASSASLQGNIYDTLVTYDITGQIVPSLAKGWQISQDALTYTFNLVQGVKFHDGTPLKAADVLYSFDRIRKQDTGANLYKELQNMDSYTAPDDNTVQVKLKQPYAVLMSALASQWAYIVSKTWGEAGNDFAKKTNGTGPFMLQTFEPQVSYTLVKNPNFWIKDRPYLDKVVETVIADDTARMNAFKSGQMQFVEYVPWQNIDEFQSNSQDKLYLGFDTFNIVRLNQQKPPLDKAEVRQALNYAIDRQAIIDVAFGGKGQPMTAGLIQKGSFWYNNANDGYWKFDTNKATQLLQQAGLKPSDIKLDFAVANISVHSDTAQAVAQQLQKLGMTINIVQQDVPTLTARRTSGEYQMMQDGLSMSWPDPDYYSTYFETGGAGHAKGVNFSDPKLDDLLKQGRQETDNAKRKAIYAQFEQQLFQDAPWIFILWRPQPEVSVASLQGYQHIPGVGLASERFMQNVWFKK